MRIRIRAKAYPPNAPAITTTTVVPAVTRTLFTKFSARGGRAMFLLLHRSGFDRTFE